MSYGHDHHGEEASTPRWYEVLQKAIDLPENKGKMAYQVATVDSENRPQVRTQIHRGFITPKGMPNMPLLITTSDVRAPKVSQIMNNSNVEVAWWLEGTMDQFRITSRAFVIPAADHPVHEAAFAQIQRRLPLMVLSGMGEEGGPGGKLDWEQKRREVFDSLRPAMRATWARPVAPGSVIESYDVPSQWPHELLTLEEIQSEEDKKKWEEAYFNFAIVLFEPFKIDWVQLGETPNRRTLFTKNDEDKWDEEILAP